MVVGVAAAVIAVALVAIAVVVAAVVVIVVVVAATGMADLLPSIEPSRGCQRAVDCALGTVSVDSRSAIVSFDDSVSVPRNSETFPAQFVVTVVGNFRRKLEQQRG